MAEFLLMVLANAKAGRDADFNDWYVNQHMRDVLKVPGMVSARRFEVADAKLIPGDPPYRYLAIYKIDAEDPQVVMDGIRARSGGPDMPTTDATGENPIALVFAPTTDVVEA